MRSRWIRGSVARFRASQAHARVLCAEELDLAAHTGVQEALDDLPQHPEGPAFVQNEQAAQALGVVPAEGVEDDAHNAGVHVGPAQLGHVHNTHELARGVCFPRCPPCSCRLRAHRRRHCILNGERDQRLALLRARVADNVPAAVHVHDRAAHFVPAMAVHLASGEGLGEGCQGGLGLREPRAALHTPLHMACEHASGFLHVALSGNEEPAQVIGVPALRGSPAGPQGRVDGLALRLHGLPCIHLLQAGTQGGNGLCRHPFCVDFHCGQRQVARSSSHACLLGWLAGV